MVTRASDGIVRTEPVETHDCNGGSYAQPPVATEDKYDWSGWEAWMAGHQNALREEIVEGAGYAMGKIRAEMEATTAPRFTADYDLITDASDEPLVDHWAGRSMRYWTSAPEGIAEVLIGGEVRVLRAVKLK